MRTIWDELFLKLVVYVGGLVSRKKVFLESSHHIYIHVVVGVEVIDINISVAVDLCIDEYYIEFW